MTEIRFYHLTRSSTDDAMPPLLEKALKGYKRIVVQCADDVNAKHADKALWGGRPDSFIPHGLDTAEHAAEQPVLVTSNDNHDHDAEMLLVLGSAKLQESRIEKYKLVCLMFDGSDDAQVQAARALWKTLKDNASLTLTYWQQGDTGWSQKS
ncbi:MAG: DNA polymerase III subunit chi [Alphaproteobacteria bacterium]|nr:DNA polymerase III subunit chi [Alphaproteobacteria bacterium]